MGTKVLYILIHLYNDIVKANFFDEGQLVQFAGRKPVTDSTFLVANASSLGFLPRPRFNAFPSCLLLCTAPATDSLLVLEVLFYTCPLSQLHCSANHLLWFFPFLFVASGPFRFCISL